MSYKIRIVTKTPIVTTVIEETVEEMELDLVAYVGMRVKEVRESLNIRQKDVARRSNDTIQNSTVSTIESGTGNPNLKTLGHMADALGVHISELFPQKEDLSEIK